MTALLFKTNWSPSKETGTWLEALTNATAWEGQAPRNVEMLAVIRRVIHASCTQGESQPTSVAGMRDQKVYNTYHVLSAHTTFNNPTPPTET